MELQASKPQVPESKYMSGRKKNDGKQAYVFFERVGNWPKEQRS